MLELLKLVWFNIGDRIKDWRNPLAPPSHMPEEWCQRQLRQDGRVRE